MVVELSRSIGDAGWGLPIGEPGGGRDGLGALELGSEGCRVEIGFSETVFVFSIFSFFCAFSHSGDKSQFDYISMNASFKLQTWHKTRLGMRLDPYLCILD